MDRTELTSFQENTFLLESRYGKCATVIHEKFTHRELFVLHLLVILLLMQNIYTFLLNVLFIKLHSVCDS
jgi:hypothetical protein